jgi:protein-S-isoprenylcysteine O-methyltransferase Ste14
VVVIVLVVLLVRSRALRGTRVTTNGWAEAVGAVLFVLGLGVAVWARRHLGRNWGTPMSHKADPDLVTSGPYRRVRHPIYSGLLLAMVGTAVAVIWYWIIVVVIAGVYFVYSAEQEERYMASQFPDVYPEYKRSTKMLIPFVF